MIQRLLQKMAEVPRVVGVSAGNDGNDLRIANNKTKFHGFQPRIEWDRYASQQRDAEQNFNIFDAVRDEDSDMLTGFDIHGEQGVRNAHCSIMKVRISRAPVWQHQRVPMWMQIESPNQKVAQR